ncbi:MAG: tRNA uridine-5-carboxymethylaminomethyl(34) synthesis GTPase MnmE [Candidatus Kapaibacteriales bacterium]
MQTNDTIAALATPPGVAGLSVIRVSGRSALSVGDALFSTMKQKPSVSPSHTVLYGYVKDERDELLDTVTMTVFKAPNSYTGEDVIEIGSHGGNIVYRKLLALIYNSGARPAEAGEFTKRAFINGKLDLTQVEAVADLIHSESEQGAAAAAQQLTGSMKKSLEEINASLKRAAGLLELELDFADDEAGFVDRGELIELLGDAKAKCLELSSGKRAADILRSGLHISLVGFPNAGKSTLFNALLGEERAITSPIAGTTRDYLRESLFISGTAVHLYDTAGLRDSEDTIEVQGIALVEKVMEKSNLILLLKDLTKENDEWLGLHERLKKLYPNTKLKTVGTKLDLANESTNGNLDICLSSVKGTGLDQLKSVFTEIIEESTHISGSSLINSRQEELLKNAAERLDEAISATKSEMGNEIIGYEIREAADKISWITGERWSEQVLNDVFSGFCIGK